MTPLTQARSKPHFPVIQPNMVQRLTQEAEQRAARNLAWDDIKRSAQVSTSQDHSH